MKGLIALTALLALAACNYHENKFGSGPETGTEPTRLEPPSNRFNGPSVRYGDLRERIFAPLCIECHNSVSRKGDLDLSTIEGARSAVVPGRPEESALFLRLSANEMPPRRRIPPLRHASAEEKALVRTWIELGTPE